ncbi:RNA polymerase sigma factor [Neptunicella marina]|uniref:Sigma-70 family RNA polymerase sigma factor n=1 Tax=Neptunicella marina TaxID=2125989 RepID=A0A8J6LZM5_9ALTE|nr:sigma-70 family RNA polymerase sigma factor [Neptunicella marina]MBC3766250.1 sigma-70 family RNA polymerase sigma factor [Neptunicella marina]
MHKRIIEQILQQYSGRIRAYLIRLVSNIDDAEDLLQEVKIKAWYHWQSEIPAAPQAWLYKVARNKAIDFLRQCRQPVEYIEEQQFSDIDDEQLSSLLDDELLKLIFICCHPSLDPAAQVALTLRLVLNFSLEQTARALLVKPKAMEQRLLRARQKISQAGIAYSIPHDKHLYQRLNSVLTCLYLLFNEGYVATAQSELMSRELCKLAMSLTELIANHYANNAEVLGLWSLMLILDGRAQARVKLDGAIVPLYEQQRSLWVLEQIQAGQTILDSSLALKQCPGPFQLQAAIASLQCDNQSGIHWPEILMLYDKLWQLSKSHVVAVNRVVVLIKLNAFNAAKRELEQLVEPLKHYHPFYLVRAEYYHQLGDKSRVGDDLQLAYQLTQNQSEREFIQQLLLRNDEQFSGRCH